MRSGDLKPNPHRATCTRRRRGRFAKHTGLAQRHCLGCRQDADDSVNLCSGIQSLMAVSALNSVHKMHICMCQLGTSALLFPLQLFVHREKSCFWICCLDPPTGRVFSLDFQLKTKKLTQCLPLQIFSIDPKGKPEVLFRGGTPNALSLV